MARIAKIDRIGGPEVIAWHDVTLPDPAAGEVRMRNTAVGLNFIDTYHRSGLYPLDMPSGLGSEAAGVVEAVGADVTDFAPGDRVATFGPTRGAYATERNVPARDLFKLSDAVDDRTAAALMLKGCTTEFMVERCAKVRAGQTVLVHAGAGGVGQLLCGWLKAIGATVIATVGSEDKVETAKTAGAAHVILYKQVDTAKAVREIVAEGVAVTFDGVGKATWEASLGATARRGLVVSFGNASGAVDGVNLGVLARSGSLFVSRPTLFDYYVTPEERAAGVARMFEMLERGAIAANSGQTFALEDVADAHRALEAGKTKGATILLP